MNTQSDADADAGESSSPRRKVLAAVGALTGAAMGPAVDTAAAHDLEDDRIVTRDCADSGLRPSDWSTGVITFRTCPGTSCGTDVYVRVTGDISHQRDVGRRQSSISTWIGPGERTSLWFTGRISYFATSDANVNVGIAQRSCR